MKVRPVAVRRALMSSCHMCRIISVTFVIERLDMTSFSDGKTRYRRCIDSRIVLEGKRETLHVFSTFFFQPGDKSLQEIPTKIYLKNFKLPQNPLFARHVVVNEHKLMYFHAPRVCRPGSSVGIASDYGLDGQGSNPVGEEIFRPSRPALGSTQSPVKRVPGLSRG